MNSRVSMQSLAAMLAIATGEQKKLCEDFIDELFKIAEEELAKGENLRVKGFGTFKLVEVEARKSVNVATGEEHEIPSHTKVIFVVSKELAAIVNAPFNSFDAEEIADDIPTDILDGTAEIEEDEELASGEYEHEEEEAFENQTDRPLQDDEAEDSTGSDLLREVPSNSNDPEKVLPVQVDDSVSEKNEESVSEYYEEMPEKPFFKRYRFVCGFIAGMVVAVIAGCAFIFFMRPDLLNPTREDVAGVTSREVAETEADAEAIAGVAVSDSITKEEGSVAANEKAAAESDVPTKPSDIVYDTVTTTRYLTTMAKEHYGNFNLWPIIYEENVKILGHPDRIRPGTRVVVPPLSKYKIDPNNVEQVKAIKQKGVEIYAKYK